MFVKEITEDKGKSYSSKFFLARVTNEFSFARINNEHYFLRSKIGKEN